ncbi:hypothetical protein BTO04_01135 [Polaribacter sp. SA4-10]|uniref:TlpA family protein disulfide reductase n=1 Tax=Polaribacter sp. SA4-10 TaxID=754397 RepID=UPI000B3CF518|nr:TlpA disulfide reductase family protein [Polaribacter sp. SA4-10]ARV05378.1 hypothetical protein BTO04_01135 [Polaribacter sp. SA4-10]
MKKAFFFSLLILIFSCKDSGKKVNKNENTIKNISSLVDLDGNTYNTSKLIGKKVLINYWATWCAPCRKEMPNLLEAQKILAKENYVFLLVSDESLELISDFKKTTNYNFTFLKSTAFNASLGIYALPTTFIYNEKGEKVEQIIGAVTWDSEEMITKLKEL